MLNFKSFRAARNILAGIELMHMIRKGQLLVQGGNERSFADQFYALAGQIRPVREAGIRSLPKHVYQLATRLNRMLSCTGMLKRVAQASPNAFMMQKRMFRQGRSGLSRSAL